MIADRRSVFFVFLERRLHALGQLENHPNEVQYFWPGLHVGLILDDHIPFLNRGKRPFRGIINAFILIKGIPKFTLL